MNKKGFTLVELILAVAIVAVLSAIVWVAIDPLTRFRESRDARRYEEVNSIVDAVKKYSVDNVAYPSGISTDLKMIGTATSGCDVICGTPATSGRIADDSQSDFDKGTYLNTQWDGANTWVELDATGLSTGSGLFTSNIKDTGTTVSWTSIDWLPQLPFYKQLLDNKGSESGYPTGNINMGNNVLLTHLNETSGVIEDSSGNLNNGSYNGTLYNQAGIFDASLGFDGINDLVSIPDVASLNINGDIAIEFWVYGNDWSTWPDIVTKGAFTESYTADIQTDGTVRFGFNDNFLNGSVNINTDEWTHVVCQRRGTSREIYVNGVLDTTDAYAGIIGPISSPLTYSTTDYPLNGQLDEVAIYSAGFSPDEIYDHYRRGANKLKFQIRSCDDASCTGESFQGPDGTGATFYSELQNDTTSTPSINLTGITDNRYFQYRGNFDTLNSSISPELIQIGFNYGGGGGGIGAVTESACLDLSSELVDQYLAQMPIDPKEGTQEMTYYGIHLDENGAVQVRACNPESGEDIDVQR